MAGGESSMTDSPWPALLMIFVIGPLFGGLGLVLATNFRGHTEWHVRKTFQLMRPADGLLSRVPGWRGLLDQPLEDRIARQIGLERFIGFVFAAVGSLVIVIGGGVFVAWLF